MFFRQIAATDFATFTCCGVWKFRTVWPKNASSLQHSLLQTMKPIATLGALLSVLWSQIIRDKSKALINKLLGTFAVRFILMRSNIACHFCKLTLIKMHLNTSQFSHVYKCWPAVSYVWSWSCHFPLFAHVVPRCCLEKMDKLLELGAVVLSVGVLWLAVVFVGLSLVFLPLWVGIKNMFKDS